MAVELFFLLLFVVISAGLIQRRRHERRENAIELLLGRVEKAHQGYFRFDPVAGQLLPSDVWPVDRQWELALECRQNGFIATTVHEAARAQTVLSYMLILKPEGRAWLHRRRARSARLTACRKKAKNRTRGNQP